MILIISDEIDQSTNDVIDWLRFMNMPFVRVNPDNNVFIEQIVISNQGCFDFILKINNKNINFNNISAIWYRKGSLSNDFLNFFVKKIKDKNILEYLYYEWSAIKNFLFFVFEKKHHLGNYFLSTPNKLIYLQKAAECGLLIPATLISSDKNVLHSFKYKKKITKSIQDIFGAVYNFTHYFSLTEQADNCFLNKQLNFFFPSLIQMQLNKLFELRIFFIKNEFYSMAIFSQENNKTKIDYRNNDKRFPNRYVPFKLPFHIQDKLSNLIKWTNLNTGSIDMVVTTSMDYYFLEINPCGQFGFVSENCNYFIDKRIAKYLIYEKESFE